MTNKFAHLYLNSKLYKFLTYIKTIFISPRFTLIHKDELEYYHDMEYRFSVFLCDATGSRMSKTNYTSEVMRSTMQDYQQESHYEIVQSDLREILDNGGSIEDVRNYIDNLT